MNEDLVSFALGQKGESMNGSKKARRQRLTGDKQQETLSLAMPRQHKSSSTPDQGRP